MSDDAICKNCKKPYDPVKDRVYPRQMDGGKNYLCPHCGHNIIVIDHDYYEGISARRDTPADDDGKGCA